MNKFISLLCISLLLAACANTKTPGVDKAPHEMSADTLCFKYASSKDPALGAEIARRDLECAAILRDDPLLYPSSGEMGTAHRIGR